MKKTLSILYILFAFVVFSGIAQSQITVSGSTGADGSYTSLTDAGGAFLAINSSVQTGNNIVISVTGDALAETGANSLNASDWASVTISPTGGAARTISGSFIGALISLNGADNVTIDGLNTGGNSLTIANTATGASSTILFIADASNNTITNCSIQGSSTASFGVVSFSTGTTTGNDANSITNCNIGPAGSNLPLYGIHSLGTSAVIDNSGNTVSGNNIYDYFSATLSTRGINLGNFNSGWTITNNKFYQTANRTYTSANTHYGIIISQGSGYTITGNVIGYANSSGTGTTNMIGLTSGALGGTFPSSYTAGGTANATRYVGINCSFLAGGAASSIQNNTIAGFALYTSSGATTTNGILCGIAVTSGTANIGTVTGNNINTLYSATTSTGGLIVGIYTSTTTGNTINIQNNTIGALDAMGTTASISGGITGINTAGTLGSYNISNNTIGNTTNPNLRMGNLTEAGNLSNTGTTFSAATGTSAFRGILNGANGTVTIGPNTIRNASQNSTSTSSIMRGIEQTASTTTGAGILTITGNTIQNLTTASTNSSLSVFSNYTTASGIILNGSLANAVVTLNNISLISLSNTTTAGTNVAGIAIGQANNPVISRNTIFDLSNASTSTNALTPGSISGILVRSGSTASSPINVVNNMISLGTSQATNTCIVGIWGNHGQSTDPSVTNIFYNSVHITGTVSSGAQPSFGYMRGDLTTTAKTAAVDVRNNIFNNERTGGTGSHYAIANNFGATASATGWIGGTSNFNVLNSASASTVAYWTTDRTFASWQTVSGSDLVSISGVSVIFVNAAAGDLHLNLGVTPTQLESAGFVIPAYTTDFDNQTRPGPAGSVNGGATNPDLGADEFDGVPLDLTKPSIIYTPFGISACLTSRILTANIFDGTGLNVTPGLKPRVYYKKASNLNSLPATNDNTTDGWKYAEASNASSPFSFTIDYSIIFGGVASGDAIEYFVVAQDLAPTPNVGDNVATFTLAPTSVALVAGNFPVSGTNAYNLTTGLTGTVTIGASGTYTSITGTGGLFEAINNNGIDGNLIAEILDAGIAETGATALNPMQTGCSPSYSLTIRPATGVTTVVSGSSATPLIDLNGADFVTFDGSNSGSSSKDMIIRNTGTGATIRLIGGAVNDTLRNCIIESQNTATTSGTVFFSTATGTGVATGNSNNVINNCDIRDRSDIAGVPANAVYSEGTNTLPNAGNKISGCNVFNFTNTGVLIAAAGAGDGWVINPSSFYQTAARTTNITFISILGGNGHSIVNNSIGGSAPNAGGSFFSSTARIIGINLNVGSTTTTSIQGNTIKNMRTTGTENNMIYAGSGSSLLDIGSVSGNIIGSSDTTERLQFSGQALTGSSGIRVVSSSLLIVNNNVVNNIHITNPNEGSGLRGIDLEASSSGSCIVENNTVTNILNSGRGSGNFSIGPSTTAGLSVFVRGINTIRGNSISKIINTSAIPSVSTNVFGLLVLQSSAGTIVEKNIITELSGSTVGTGTLATSIVGLQTSSSAIATVANNLISLDGGSSSDRIIVGINEQSGTNGAVNFYYNTVNIYGTSTGSNNTFAFNRSSFARAPVVLRNNVFSNARVAATGSNIALANEVTSPNTTIGWPSGASEHNALHSLNPATLIKWGATIYDLSGYQSVSGCDLYTFAGDPGFTSNTNLIPDASNVNCWTLNGNGIALNDVATDILGNPRSTSIFTGGTDIGAYEFDATVLPPNYNNATGAPGTYRFIHRLDTMATINVTTLGTLADLNVKYFSGEVPPGVASNNPLTFGNGDVYWEISPTDLSNTDYTYDLTLHYSPALTGTITNERNIKVAKNNGVDTFYVPFLIEGTGPSQYQIDTSKNNITVYGLTEFSRFILTDGDIPQPVELSSFTASVNRRDVNLNWSTSTETNNSGFDVERRITGGEWLKVASVNGNGTTTSQKNYSVTDKNLSTGKYEYRLKQMDYNGNFTYYDLSSEVSVGLPTKFEMSQNYPNPFNPATKINYDLPVDGKVSIALYDISGREVAKLVNEVKTAGYYTVQFNASNLSSGTYFYRISAEGNGQKYNDTKKMVLIK
jgi:hypothetical protein